ncbi:MAG: ATP-binding protein, partial [Thermodesulfobacteriota bacterium]
MLRGELTADEAARRYDVPLREIERWQRRFLVAGKRALTLDVAPPARAAVDAAGSAGLRQPEGGSFAPAEEWLRLLPEQVQGVSWTTDADLRFTSVSGMLPIAGAPAAALIGVSLYDFFQTDDAGFAPIANHLLALQGRPGSYETTFGGRIFDYRLEALRDASGRITGVIGTALDVTDRKRSETALREQEARVRFLMEQIPAILWTTDRELRITSSMGAGLAAIGLAPEQLNGRSLREYLAAHELGESQIEGHLAALRGESGLYEGQWSGRDYETYFQPLRDVDDAIVGVVGLTIDITERKQVERQREELLVREQAAREQAEEASRLKDEFLATISHELRTPLNAILGWAHLLREDDLDPETRARAIETIERNSRSQARLIQDLLDVSHIVTGRTRLDIRPVTDVAPIISAALDSLRPAALAKSIRLHHACDPDAGPILADPERLQQIVWNLVSNGIKFTPKGGRVHVWLERANSKLQVRVSDTGEGIAADFLPYVFDRFRQADASAARRHAGLGLGLAIVRHLVELQGGEVRAESEGEGKGAIFTVSFPVLPVRIDDDARDASVACGDEAGRISLDGLRVMAVDDEPDTLEMIRAVLERCRAQVRTATSALEGLKQLSDWTPDVLLADIGMPVRDGYWLIRRVRDLAPDRGGRIPAVALTAFARHEDRLRTLSAGFQTHVAKPVEPAELIAVIS